MRWSNDLGLPEPIVRAVTNDPYDRGHSDFTVTQLIAPARARVLRKRHAHLITEDVADRIYSLLGQSIHTILERAEVEHMAEVRLYAKLDGLTISGQLDRCAFFPDGLLQDYKLTSVWTDLDKSEWAQQTNMLVWLLAANGYNVKRGEIVAIFRDWSKSRAKREHDYPQHQVKLVPIELWPIEKTIGFVRERIHAHVEAELGVLPNCTNEERWYRGEQWAVIKNGNKRATRVFDFPNQAEAFAKTDSKFKVEHRPGQSIRCAEYCTAYPFCAQAHAELRT